MLSDSETSVTSQSLTTEQASIPTTIVTLANGSKTRALLSRKAVQISLDSDEEKLFQTLVATADLYVRGKLQIPDDHCGSTTSVTPLEIRVAGGWVRDKLLGLETHDVDVAVDSLTGVQFAKLVQGYLQQNSTEQSAGRIGVIAANPSQSKHLETATMKIGRIEVDFCNLRAEELYEDHSRIPIVRFGSPLEDAKRRDFTVNALFFNLHTRLVEDWTKVGIPDLISRRIVTPLEPVRTFLDDPLRVIRAIRFAVRYDFELDPALEAACMCTEIHQALHVKVSRERVGKELEGMLSGRGANPIMAMDLIARLKLAGSVFCLPKVGEDNVSFIKGHILGNAYTGQHDSNDIRKLRELGWEESRALLQLAPFVVASHIRTASKQAAKSGYDKRLLPLGVFMLPFRTLLYGERQKLDKELLAIHYVFREGIKFKNKDVQAMVTLYENVDNMISLLTGAADGFEGGNVVSFSRVDVGMQLRATKELWVTCLLMATIVKLRQQKRRDDGFNLRKVDWVCLSDTIYGTIIKLNLDECWKMRPLLDGKAVIQSLDLPRGPTVGLYLDEQVKWMLLNPSGSRDECEAHLKSVKRRLDCHSFEQNAGHLGISDGKMPSSPNQVRDRSKHFSKKLHIEHMDTT
jgi:tRNA nucleotidyltransferase (CCA-adding enzyme)